MNRFKFWLGHGMTTYQSFDLMMTMFCFPRPGRYIRADVGKEFHFIKLPNFLSVEPRPYDASTYEAEIDEEEALDEEGTARIKLKVKRTWESLLKKGGIRMHSLFP